MAVRRARIRSALLALAFVCAAEAQVDERTAAVNKLLAPLRDPNAPGCAIGVIQGGRFLYKTAFGLADLDSRVPLTTATPFNVASMTKQFTAAALFFLIDSGKLRLGDPIRRFFPELPLYADSITVADLVHHTSGIRDFGPLLEIAGRAEDSLDLAQSIKLLARQRALNFTPGAGYEYTNSDYLLLGALVERVTGKSLGAFAEEHLFAPLHMSSTQFYDQLHKLQAVAAGYAERNGRFRKITQPLLTSGAGGLYTSIEDLLRWDDNFNNPAVGGPAFLNFMFARGRLRSGEPLPYAAGLIVGRYSGLEAVSHPGSLPGFRAEMIRFPAQRITVACLCNRSDEQSPLLARRIADVYLEDKLHPLPGAVDLDYPASGFPELDGVWESPQGWILRAWSSTDSLWVELPDGEFKLYPLNQKQLFADTGTNRLVLTKISRDSLTLAWDRFPAITYRRLDGASADPVDPAPYTGDYTSSDADARYRIFFDSGRLWISGAAAWNVAVNPVGADRFLAGPWTLHFLREPGGRVRGMQLHGPRLWNLWFDKTVDTVE